MDIIVTRTRNPISWWIRWRTGSEWSHILLAGEDNTVYTTTAKGYSHLQADKYLKGKEYAVYRMQPYFALVPNQLERGLAFSNGLLGIPYAYSDFARLLGRNLFGKGTKGVKHNSSNVYCAESVAETYNAMGIKLMPQLGKKPNEVMPHELILDYRLELVYTNAM